MSMLWIKVHALISIQIIITYYKRNQFNFMPEKA